MKSPAAVGRRAFMLGMGGTLAACAQSKLVTTAYPRAEACRPEVCTKVDVHCHVFNGSDLNVKGFISHILPAPTAWTEALAEQLHRELDRRAPSAAEEQLELAQLAAQGTLVRASGQADTAADLGALAQKLFGAQAAAQAAGATGTLGNLRDTLGLVVRPRRQIAATLVQTYAQVDLFTPALVDYSYWSADFPESPIGEQLRVQAALSRLSMAGLVGRPGARMHPFAPFNPLREVREVIETSDCYEPLGAAVARGEPYACDAPGLDPEMTPRGALGLLRQAVETLGFIGAKVYPPTGFLPLGNADFSHHRETGLGEPLDRALRALYAYCEAEEVPLMTHANNTNGYALGYGLLTGPAQWERVLREFPRLRLNLGHFGGLEGDDPARGLEGCELWMRQIADLMERYPNVYADSGCSQVPVEQAHQDRYLSLLEQLYKAYPRAKQRFMYGSDFWLNKLYPRSETFVDAFDALFSARFPDQRADFMGANALRFLGFLDDDGKKPAASRNRERLQAFYGDLPRPAWL